MQDNKNTLDNIKTWTREKLQNETSARITEISKEFTEGFKFLEDYPASVTFFGAHQTKHNHVMYENARTLAGRVVTELGYSVLTGGSSGIMEAANRGAYEAGGNSLGLSIRLPHEQEANKYLTKEIVYYYFFARKVCLSFSAEAFIFYPGGFGTMDEFFEILTLVQTKKIENVPIICVGSEYWGKVRELMESEMLTREAITREHLELFTITNDHDEIIDIIKKVPVRGGIPFNAKAVDIATEA